MITDTTVDLSVPELSLVVLIGSTGSGKSTFAREHFPHTAIVSSDACRGIVSDDENDQAATPDAFALVHHIAGIRLRRGLRTVIDATNVQPHARKELVAVARAHDVLPVAIVLDVPDAVCVERNKSRPERAHVAAHVVHRQQRELRRSLRHLEREGFREVYVLRGLEEIAHARIVDEKAWNDKRDLTGPFDVIGDVHGCRAELETLLGELGYALDRDEAGRPVGARHPEGRTAVFVGDLVDRGPDTPGVLRLVMGMVAAGTALCVTGNHEFKLVRALDGKKVRVAHGLAESLAQLEAEDEAFRKDALEFCRGLISHYVLDGGNLVVAHAGLKEEYHGRASGRVRSFAMYGESTGETDEYGLPVRYPWADDYRGRATVLYGHTPVTELRWVNNTLCLDTGVVFGGKLSALRYPEREPVSVAAEQVWYEPVRPLAATTVATGDAVVRRDPGVLDLDDVLGKRVVQTRHHGRIGVQEENAGAALEVMSRFAVDPRWLVYLPPTMSPCATSESDGYLEHPAEAFAYYRSEGVRRVVCEEKHMGSRAVVVVTRSAEAALRRFGLEETVRSTRGPAVRSSTTRRGLRHCSPGCGRQPRRRACSRSCPATGCCSTPSCCRGRRRRSGCCAISTRPSARRPARRSARPPRCSPRWRRADWTWASSPSARRCAAPMRPPSPPPTAGTAGRRRDCRASGSRRSSCWPPRASTTPCATTAGTSSAPTAWSPPIRSCSRPPDAAWWTCPIRKPRPPRPRGGRSSPRRAGRAWW